MTSFLRIWKIDPHGPVPLSLPASSLDEASRLLPQGLYSTFRTFAGRTRALDLRHHLARLYRPAAQAMMRPSVDERALRRVLAGLLAAFDTPHEARVRLSLSTEAGSAGTVFIALEPLQPLPDEVYRLGVRAVTSPAQRTDPLLKSTAFIAESGQARAALAAAGAFEGLMLRNGRILEGLTSNFYYVMAGVLGTAGRDILPGVTRRLVLRLARMEGLRLSYRALRPRQLPAVDEAFITSSSRGIVPLVRIDGIVVGQGRPGPVTLRLMARYDAYVEAHAGLIGA